MNLLLFYSNVIVITAIDF